MPVSRSDSEAGFTMIATVIGTTLVIMLALVAVAAVNGDIHQQRRNLDQKQAYEAAKAGIEDYAFHLNHDTGYWAKCTGVPTPNAVNQVGSTAKRRFVPGSATASYALELIPAEGQAECEPANATPSMLEGTGPMKGTFRIRATGYAGPARSSVTATFKSASFLDFVYFTQLETLDPVTYGYPAATPQLEGVKKQCSLTYQQGRNNAPYYEFVNPETKKTEQKFCLKISFVGKDVLSGPVHTNDTMAICENGPTFGRNAQDIVEVSASYPGWYANCNKSVDKPNFKGTFITGAAELKPPESDEQLKEIAEPAFRFAGQVRICLTETTMTVGAGGTCNENVKYSGPLPANGVVYVSNGPEACPATYSPFTVTYPVSSECGNAYVHSVGTYSGQLTIAAENDIIIDGSICWAAAASCTSKSTGTEMLGLIANNFIRVYHDYPAEVIDPNTISPKCNALAAGQVEKTVKNITIDAAILSLNHSFIVDHYDCGTSLGTVTINGALAQKYRGPVGQGSQGYQSKVYKYDDRLKYQEPPSFIQPEKLPWLIGRETIG
ncbi:MAG TPA: type II secretion system protein [Solirubrobacterales bacterium]|nr:type II secretion system protein [Solirubrobacterales bacterium]